MYLYSRYQTFCRFCSKKFESDTTEQVLSNAYQHELENHKDKLNPVRVTMDDFFPRQFKQINPAYDNAEVCSQCKSLSMAPFQTSSTARQCANPDCRFVEERVAV